MTERRIITSQNKVDYTALKFHQFCVVALLVLAFFLDSRPLVMFVMLVLGIGTLFPRAGLFTIFYNRIMRKQGFLIARFVERDPAPYMFAQRLEAIVLAIGFFFLIAFKSLTGWILTGIVVASAAMHLMFNFSLGCFLYYRLARWGFIDRPFQHQRQSLEGSQRNWKQYQKTE
jgi:hypothetical protein